MVAKFYSIDAFHDMVRGYVKEAIQANMLQELHRLHLKELGGVEGTEGTNPTQGTTGTSSASETTGTKSGIKTQSGNNDPANNVMIPGTNLSVNAGLQTASKETNFKKKADLINKISSQLSAMKGVVVN
jgi:hypothetical protein